jgi:hypothetical protein
MDRQRQLETPSRKLSRKGGHDIWKKKKKNEKVMKKKMMMMKHFRIIIL